MSMNIDIESIGLLSLILQDSPKDRQLILCALARSNSVPARITFNPNTEYSTFYGYSNSRIPHYLMGNGVLNNVPRGGSAKKLVSAHYLSHAETVISNAKNWDIHQKLMSVSRYFVLDNRTAYKDAEVFLVFKDKALDYIKGYATAHQEELSSFLGPELSKEVFKTIANEVNSLPSENVPHAQMPSGGNIDWSEDFVWKGNDFIFGNYGKVSFVSPDRKKLFKLLTDAKGNWVTVQKMEKETGKDEAHYIRPTIGQIEHQFRSGLRKYVSIPSTRDDDAGVKPSQGAYRIRFIVEPQQTKSVSMSKSP